MKKHLSKLFVLPIILMTLTLGVMSCKKNDKPEGPGSSGEANTVSGLVVNAQGQPMPGVKVRADNPNGNNIHVEGTTDANGKYKLKLTSIGGWKIYAWKEVQFMGKTYILRLAMKNATDYDAFATEDKAIVRDFVWKLEGRIPDRPASADYGTGYFGGSVHFVNLNGIDVAPLAIGTRVTVTLTPVSGATYLDGTTATTTVTKSFTITSGTNNYYIGDIKVTNYRMTVESELNGTRKVVYMSPNTSSTNASDYGAEITFYFDPVTLSTGSYGSGIQTGNETPFYMTH